MHLSPSIVHDLVFALALWSFYPLVYKLYNQNPKKPILLDFVLWDCVGLFFRSLRTIFGTNIFGPIGGDEAESLLSLGYSSFNWFWEVELNQQIFKDYISPNISQWILKELEQEVDLVHLYNWVSQT